MPTLKGPLKTYSSDKDRRAHGREPGLSFVTAILSEGNTQTETEKVLATINGTRPTPPPDDGAP